MVRILASSLLVLSLCFPAAAKASNPASDAPATTPVHVSTGVTVPVLLDAPDLKLPPSYAAEDVPAGYRIGVSLTVDENGQPQNVQLNRSYDAFLDGYVVNAVRQFRFRPATLNSQAVPVDLKLNVEVER